MSSKDMDLKYYRPLVDPYYMLFWIYSLYTCIQNSSGGSGSGGPLGSHNAVSIKDSMSFLNVALLSRTLTVAYMMPTWG